MQLAYRACSTDPCSGLTKMRYSRLALYCHGGVEDLRRIGGLFVREGALLMRPAGFWEGRFYFSTYCRHFCTAITISCRPWTECLRRGYLFQGITAGAMCRP